jgi:hypothetical protein
MSTSKTITTRDCEVKVKFVQWRVMAGSAMKDRQRAIAVALELS